MSDSVNHPDHYGGKDNPYEVIKVIDEWELGFNLGNTVKYIARAGKKDPDKRIEDLKKARFYLDYEIEKSVSTMPVELDPGDDLRPMRVLDFCQAYKVFGDKTLYCSKEAGHHPGHGHLYTRDASDSDPGLRVVRGEGDQA